MAKKPLQFQVPEKLREEMEQLAQAKGITLSELLRQSLRVYIILSTYTDQGYKLSLQKDDEPEKEIIFP